MNSSGIIRKVDDLGRIVIPIEIRKNLNIRVGENLEFLFNEDSIILKKRSLTKQYIGLMNDIEKSLSSIIDGEYIITDREKIIFSSNHNLMNVALDYNILKYLSINEEYTVVHENNIVKGKDIYVFRYVVDNSVAGLFILYDINDVSKYIKLIKFIKNFINDSLSIS